MKKDKPDALQDLRTRAAEIQRGWIEELEDASDVQSLIHELQNHQIELEMQNEELRRAQRELEESRNRITRLNRLSSVLSKINEAIVRIREPEKLYEQVCRIAVEHGLFRMAWIGMVDYDSLFVKPVAHWGFEEGYLDNIRVSIRDVPEGHGPTGSAIHEGKHFICNDIEHDPGMIPWRNEAIKRGYRSSAAFPLQVRKRMAGALNIYATEPNFFDDEEVHLLKEMAGNISFALESMEQEEVGRRTEEALETMLATWQNTFDAISDGVWILDPEGRIIQSNGVFERMLGLKTEDAIGQHCYEITQCAHGFMEGCPFKRMKMTGRREYSEMEDKKRGLWFQITADPLPDMSGEVKNAVHIMRDITGSKRALEMRLENIRLENERLACANKVKSEILAVMNHELRTPLTSVIGYSILMKEKTYGELNEKQESYVDNILASSAHLHDIINNTLDMAKIESGKMDLVIETVSVSETINEILNLVKENAQKSSVVLEKEIDPELHVIEAEKQKFKQILFNLLSNAIKFSKVDGGVVTISAKKEGDMAKISVSDTGIGIREEDLPRLFQKFQQLNSGLSRKYKGTGLGLAITKQLVEMHGGEIMVESRFGEGSTFTFLMPLIAKKGN